jgi:RNA polymerase sigma factor (sigma-70 family)
MPSNLTTTALPESPLHARLASLEARLRRRSWFLNAPSQTHDDLYQIMVLALLEKNLSDPNFINQNDTYWLKYATWQAKHACNADYTYLKYVDEDGANIDAESEELVLETELATDRKPTPEQLVASREFWMAITATAKMLSQQNRQVIHMVVLGYSKQEIADALHITRQTVNDHTKTIANALRKAIN